MDEGAGRRARGGAVTPGTLFHTLDAHVAGEAVRLITSGMPAISGRTMRDKLAWVRRKGDSIRQTLMLEPRGHAGMHGVILTEPSAAQAHAGVLFMDAGGWPEFSGEGVIGAVTLALEENLLHVNAGELLVDTPAGAVVVRPSRTPEGVKAVTLIGLPSFVLSPAIPLSLPGRQLRADIAFGGGFYAIVDSESAGITMDARFASQIVRSGLEIKAAIESSSRIVHPEGGPDRGLQGVILTAPATDAADLRTATVLDGGVLRRSPGVDGVCAILAVLDAMGVIVDDQWLTVEGLAGTTLRVRVESRRMSNGLALLVPELVGSAYRTGSHEFVVDPADDLDPFQIG